MEYFLNLREAQGYQPQAAALAVAGAVEDNAVPMTNISWVIDGNSLEAQFGFK